MPDTGEGLRELLQQFVDARIDAPLLFGRAGDLLPPGTDATEQILTRLTESEFELRLPEGRGPLVKRFNQIASGETSYTELDLWFFTLTQIKEVDSDTPSPDPETELLRTIIQWSQEWDDELQRPTEDMFKEFVEILRSQSSPATCLDQIEEVLARNQRD